MPIKSTCQDTLICLDEFPPFPLVSHYHPGPGLCSLSSFVFLVSLQHQHQHQPNGEKEKNLNQNAHIPSPKPISDSSKRHAHDSSHHYTNPRTRIAPTQDLLFSRIIHLTRLEDLGLRGRREFSTENAVPEAGSDAEAVLVIGEVVLEVVFLQFAPVGWEAVKRQVSQSCGLAPQLDLQ